MKRLTVLAAIFIAICAVTYVSASGLLVRDMNDHVIQGFAPDPNLTQEKTVNTSNNISLSGLKAYRITNKGVGDMYFRNMQNTVKANWPKSTLESGDVVTNVVHPNNLYLNYSGATKFRFEGM